MKILKASAGSGKTYRLSNTYLDLLLKSSDLHPYRHILAVTFTNKATAEMKGRILRDLGERAKKDSRAKALLVEMLHDYSAFSVSTIDKFFQQTLKAFSREIGQFADYQIELDRQSLISESMDRILDSLTEDKRELLDWITASVSAQLNEGGKPEIDQKLYSMGKLLKSEEHRILSERLGVDDVLACDKERLEAVRAECRRVIDGFTSRAGALGIPCRPGEKIVRPGVRMMKAHPEWEELFEEPYVAYCTALTIDSLIFSLGLAGEFYKEFDALLKEKNVMCLDESNTILRDIIGGSDAPFVYEKLGVRFENFLLDEFQDTSNIQWSNFYPLLRESESKGGGNLIVGDVKQSIYRFRDSDWRLLGQTVPAAFPDAEVESLDENWRSTPCVVGFNNRFFTSVAQRYGRDRDVYSSVEQKPRCASRGETQEGCVQVTFTDDQMQAVTDSIARARSWGARWNDIAVLVRNNRQGSDIAARLLEDGIPVISDDSLNVKSSGLVRRLVSLLSVYENPEDEISSFLARSLNVEFPEHYHSLGDLCELLLRAMTEGSPDALSGEVAFVQAFMDDVQNWTSVNGNNLRQFLKHWEESRLFIASPESSDAVRVLTVHKSKGLEFPYLIFPFADKVEFYHVETHWSELKRGSSPLSEVADGIYPVELSSSSLSTGFAHSYETERDMQFIDNINVFYVALTRAEKCLHVIAKTPSKTLRDKLSRGKDADFSRFSDLLYEFCGQSLNYVAGSPYDFSAMKREAGSAAGDFEASYPSIPLAGRLLPSTDASDYFGEDGTVGTEASARLNGIVLHGILSRVDTPSDLEGAVNAAVIDGSLTPEQGRAAAAFLKERISAHPEWFPEDLKEGRVLNEKAIFGEDGAENRPDRVLLTEKAAVIIDFKFGKDREKKYLGQVGRYAGLYRSLGYEVLSAVVWYVPEDEYETI